MKNQDYNQIKSFISLEIIGEEDKDKKNIYFFTQYNIYLLSQKKKYVWQIDKYPIFLSTSKL